MIVGFDVRGENRSVDRLGSTAAARTLIWEELGRTQSDIDVQQEGRRKG